MIIRIEPHTKQRAKERGVSEEEIRDTLDNGMPVFAKPNRLCKSKVFPFMSEWNGKIYEEKKVNVFYLIENNEIITITVYVYYGKF
jgi:hypothetical protein